MKIEKVNLVRGKYRYVQLFLVGFGFLLTAYFAYFWFNPLHIPHNFSGYLHIFDYLIFLVLSYIVWQQIIKEAFSWWISLDMKLPVEVLPEKDKKIAFVTAFVPGKEPYEVLEKTLYAMVTADYLHDSWVLDEGDDLHVKEICEAYGAKHFSRYGKVHFNRTKGRFKAKTKAGNYNSWFAINGYKYDYVAQLDVDFVPNKNFLTSTIGYFQDSKVAFVGTPQIYGNQNESFIARGAAEQAFGFYGTMQRGFSNTDMSLFIGANHVVRVSALDNIGWYSGHIVEDHLTGMHFYAKGWKSVYVPQVLAVGEGPATWSAYFSQQMRWAYGLMDIYFKKSPKILRKMKLKHAIRYFLLQQHYFDGVAQVLAIGLITLYFIFGFQATTMSLFYLVLLYVPLILWQQVIYIWLQRYNVDYKNEIGLHLLGRLVTIASWPIYFIAFWSVITGKKINYKVTPKGDCAEHEICPQLFLPHFIIGSVTLAGLLISMVTDYDVIHMVVLAAINTILMYMFFVFEFVKLGAFYTKKAFVFTKKAFTQLLPTYMFHN